MASVDTAPARSEDAYSEVNIALCADRNILPGLHVTLYTTLTNLSASRFPVIWLLHGGLSAQDIEQVRDTLGSTGRHFVLHPVDVNIDSFRRFKWIGGWMSYARLLLPSVISPSRVTYLDCDLIVLADVSQLSDTELDGSPVGAVVDSTIARSNDARLFLRLGLNGNDPYFNAGVMQMDLTMWREGSLFAECMEFAERYSNSLLSADQTILNYVLHSRFRALPETFNVPLYSSARRRLGEEFVQGQIYHLVGRPKPWDFLGEYLNQYSSDFSSHLKSTALATYRSHRNVSVSTVPRVFRMGKSYWKCLRAKLRRN